jgi:hypothetical protein
MKLQRNLHNNNFKDKHENYTPKERTHLGSKLNESGTKCEVVIVPEGAASAT